MKTVLSVLSVPWARGAPHVLVVRRWIVRRDARCQVDFELFVFCFCIPAKLRGEDHNCDQGCQVHQHETVPQSPQ